MSDLISRDAAIDALNEYFVRIGKLKRRGLNNGEKAIRLDTVGAINSLPPAQPEPCEDAVSREMLVNFIKNASVWVTYKKGDSEEEAEFAENVIKQTKQAIISMIELDLPSATPKQRTGYWYPVGMVEAVGGESAQWGSAIAYHKCSECDGQALKDDFENEVLSDFCPHCGAKMEGDAE